MLFSSRLRLISALLFLFSAGCLPLFGQDAVAAPQFTADEMFLDARRCFNEGDYAGAAAGFNKFKQDFGSSTQAADANAEMRYPLAVSLLNLQKFEEASDAIAQALDSPPPLPPAQKEVSRSGKAFA